MPTDMKFLSLVSNDLLTKSEAKERSRAKLLAVNMTIVNQGKAVSYDCQSSYHRKVGLSGIFAQIKKEPTSDIMKCECQDCHHTFSTASKKYLFCFCSSAVISSGPLASSKIQAYSGECWLNF
uniref:Uncharacterized protein n=1 Tax=Solanum tuberosum TaxID=4113 RepID=M1BID7_SOLTU